MRGYLEFIYVDSTMLADVQLNIQHVYVEFLYFPS
jgi:hypothetical protein